MVRKDAQEIPSKDKAAKDEGGEGNFQIVETGSNFPILIQGEDGGLAIDKGALLLVDTEKREQA